MQAQTLEPVAAPRARRVRKAAKAARPFALPGLAFPKGWGEPDRVVVTEDVIIEFAVTDVPKSAWLPELRIVRTQAELERYRADLAGTEKASDPFPATKYLEISDAAETSGGWKVCIVAVSPRSGRAIGCVTFALSVCGDPGNPDLLHFHDGVDPYADPAAPYEIRLRYDLEAVYVAPRHRRRLVGQSLAAGVGLLGQAAFVHIVRTARALGRRTTVEPIISAEIVSRGGEALVDTVHGQADSMACTLYSGIYDQCGYLGEPREDGCPEDCPVEVLEAEYDASW